MSGVAVYQDYVHNNGSLAFMLQELGVPFRFVNHESALDGFSTLIMPGGADLYYCEKLDGDGNARIRRFVEQGGGYIGICAGAYYGCTSIDWCAGEIAGPRALGFIDACATGPIKDFMQDGDIAHSWYGAPILVAGDASFPTLYAAGPTFENLESGADILATYEGRGPAVIGKRVGRGYAVLSSPHIEVSALHFAAGRYAHKSPFAAYEAQVAKKLAGFERMQQSFFKSILEKAGCPL